MSAQFGLQPTNGSARQGRLAVPPARMVRLLAVILVPTLQTGLDTRVHRALFPQLDRGVFRADLGFPIERPLDAATSQPIPPLAFLLSFGQAINVPSVAPTAVLPTEQVEVPDLTP